VIETAVSLLERLRACELSAVELLDAHLERVDRLNPE
jgi:Asp-tRNA(Asn)/Glu-tRNA(Gln) amidotransferase A subunit family amidase